MKKLVFLIALFAVIFAGVASTASATDSWEFPFSYVLNENGQYCGSACGVVIHRDYYNATIGPLAASNTVYHCTLNGISYPYNFGRPGELGTGCTNVNNETFYAIGPPNTTYDVWARKGCPVGGGYMFSNTDADIHLPSSGGAVRLVQRLLIVKPAGGCQTAMPLQGTLAEALNTPPDFSY